MPRVKAALLQDERHKSRSLGRDSNVEGHKWCIVAALGERGQLSISTAEQPQARSAPLQVMLHHEMQVQSIHPAPDAPSSSSRCPEAERKL